MASRIICVIAVNVIVAQCILLENINIPPQTTPFHHPDTLTFLLQEVIQMKNGMLQNSKEIEDLKMVVANLSARNSNISDETDKLHTEIAVLKFTVQNAQNDHSHPFNNANYTDVLSKLHNVENALRHFTFALNEKASKAEINAIQQRLASLSTSVPQISSHEASLDVLLKNITERVHDLEYGEIIPGRIRLLNGSTSWMGRVEVSYNGTWATIPSFKHDSGLYSFDDNAAKVVCRMLGYTTRNAAAIHVGSPLYFGKGTGHVNMDLYGLHCNGDENSLYECIRHPTDNRGLLHAHKYDAGVVCMDIRLAGGSSPMNGRVEVNLGEGWGTVCDDRWDDNEARVVCRMLGYHGTANALQGSSTTGGTGVMWMDDLECTGTEASLAQCKRSLYDIGFANCAHTEDARVVCNL